jgi:glycosyltransferase involved in cell wall biosynthesis
VRVGFDAHMVGQRETGNETYALGILNGLGEIGFAVDVYVLGRLTHTIHRAHRIWPRSSIVRIPLSTPFIAARDNLSLYHATYVLPPLLPCKALVTVHDISFALHPEWFRPSVRRILDALVPLSLRKAARVIAISEFTKREIVERYRIDPDHVVVTYLAPRPAFGLSQPRQASDEPFFLFVGTVEPRKNLETLIRALRINSDRGVDLPLVVAGKPGFHHERAMSLVRTLQLDRLVRFKGYVSDPELQTLYSSCLALVHPSLYEGFGLTPLEAMTQGAPAIVANASSLPEVVSDAALLVSPTNAEAWADAMAKLAGDRAMQTDLSLRGTARASRFSWTRCAQETLAVYHAVCPQLTSVH